MATISVCMIVKNEEAVLARCLDCIKDFADEIVIVDTGSTDRTKEIATQYTDLIFDFPWIHNFAAARNFSFSKATMDYIYVADADEIIDKENQEKLLQLKKIILPEIELVQMKYTNQLEHNTTYNFNCEYRPKMYKRLRTFRWENPIHESVALDPVIFNSDIEIIHRPTDNHASRDLDIYKINIKNNVHLSKQPFIMYAKELFIAGTKQDFLDAEEYFMYAMNMEPRGEDELHAAQCVVARAARLREDYNNMMKACLKNLVAEHPCSEICYELGEFYIWQEEWEEAILWYYNAAFESESMLNVHYHGDLPLYRLSQCYEKLGDEKQSAFYHDAYLNWELPLGDGKAEPF